MTQTASFKDKFKSALALFRWEVRSCAGTLTVYSILAAVFSAVILTLSLALGFLISSNIEPDTGGVELSDVLHSSIAGFQLAASYMVYYLSIIFTIIYTIRVFSYLHSKRKADLYGAMPVSRVTLYLTKAVTGYLFSIVPAMFFLSLIAIVSIAFGQPLVNEAAGIYVKLLLGSLACISAYGLLAVCCGTTLNSVLTFVLMCVAYPLSAMFVKGVIGGFFYGLYSGILRDNFILNALNPLAAYDGINVIYWLIFTAVCVAGAVALIRRRRFERAQESFAYYLPCHIIKLLIAFLAGMFLGMVFGALNVFGVGYAGFAFGFVLGSVPAFIISHLIFYKGFRKLPGTLISLGVMASAVVLAVGFCSLDVFGYNSFNPADYDVVSAGFADSGSAFIPDGKSFLSTVKDSAEDFTTDDSQGIESIEKLHAEYLDAAPKNSREKILRAWLNMFADNMYIDLDLRDRGFAYKLSDGRTVTRIYSGSLYDEVEYLISDTVLSNVVGNVTYFEKHSAMMNMKPDSQARMSVESLTGSGSAKLEFNDPKGVRARKMILDAYREDFAASREADFHFGYSYPVDYFDYEDYYNKDDDDIVCVFEIEHFGTDNPLRGSGGFLSVLANLSEAVLKTETIYIHKGDTNTLRTLTELSILNADGTLNSNSIFAN